MNADDCYPNSNMQDFAAMFKGNTTFTTMNLDHGFHHICINKAEGEQNVALDALSRASINKVGFTLILSLDFTNMAALQRNSRDMDFNHRTMQIRCPYNSKQTLLCDVSKHNLGLIIYNSLCCLFFNTVHNLVHPGIKPIQHFILQKPIAMADISAESCPHFSISSRTPFFQRPSDRG